MTYPTRLVLPEKRVQSIVWTLLCLMPIIGMAVDLVAPSLPAIASSLHVSDKIAKNLISIYLLGYALGNFFTGFLTDAFGRRTLIRCALCGFTLVSLIPVFFANIELVLLARFLQGITIGAVSVLARSIFADILPLEKLVSLGTLIGTMWGLGPIIGPVIGGYLQFYFGWKAGFCFFAFIALLGFIAVVNVVPETHFNRQPLHLSTIKNNLIEVITHRSFMALIVLMGLVYSLLIAFNTAGPFLIQTQLHHSAVFFGHLALWLGLVFLLSTFVCRYFLKKYKLEQLLLIAMPLFFFIALLAVIASYFFSKSIILIITASAFMFFASGFIYPMSMGKGMSLFRHIAGTATAMMYLINTCIVSLIAFLISFVNIQSAIPLMWMYVMLFLLSVFVYWGWIRRSQ